VIPGTDAPNGYSYAIPINTAMEVVHQLLAHN
jgi:S1-C subfamily serine protease